MIAKRVIAVAAGVTLMLAVTFGLALAQGWGGHGHGGGDHGLRLLAHAAGLTGTQIRTAFQNDANLQNDRAALKTAHQALISCLVAGNCTNQVATYASALQAITQERLTVWQNLFKGAPSLSQAASVYSQLQQLQASKAQIMQSIFGSQGGEGGSESSTTSPNG
jgi:hypothetical protein